jgi:phosphoribosyl-ATP pyrophosphohydrolase
MSDSLDRLYIAVLAAKTADPPGSRTARLLQAGRPKMAKKLAEEAVEVVLEAIRDDRDSVIRESADLLYHLVMLWTSCGVLPSDVWQEMDRRERLFGMAEKLPKPGAEVRPQGWARQARRTGKRR